MPLTKFEPSFCKPHADGNADDPTGKGNGGHVDAGRMQGDQNDYRRHRAVESPLNQDPVRICQKGGTGQPVGKEASGC